MKRKWFNVILVVCVLVFVASGGYLYRYFYVARETEVQLSELKEYQDTGKLTKEEKEEAKKEDVLEKYLRLYKKNNDLVGWIQCPGTAIDYPVMQHPGDNEYYLHRDFHGVENANGLPFLDGVCDTSAAATNFLIYGHHMKSGLMFAELMNYKDEEFYTEHKKITFDTLHEAGTYQVLAACYTDVSEEGFPFGKYAGTLTKSQAAEYIERVKELSLYDTAVDTQSWQSLVTLVTCSYHVENGRFIVVAVK